jgi:hypothetical protein
MSFPFFFFLTFYFLWSYGWNPGQHCVLTSHLAITRSTEPTKVSPEALWYWGEPGQPWSGTSSSFSIWQAPVPAAEPPLGASLGLGRDVP